MVLTCDAIAVDLHYGRGVFWLVLAVVRGARILIEFAAALSASESRTRTC
jgi:hypothetical protein